MCITLRLFLCFFRCCAVVYRFSGKWFREETVILYASLLEGQGVLREPPAGILSSWLSRKGTAAGGHCCSTHVRAKPLVILAKLAYAKDGSNTPWAGQKFPIADTFLSQLMTVLVDREIS